MEVTFKTVLHASNLWKDAVELRENILRKPLGAKFTIEELEEEKNHFQIVGLLNNQLVATAVLVPELKSLKMQRVVVSEEQRNKNIGSAMMTFCETYAKENGFHAIYCHARDSAVNFYRKNSYNPEGDYFEEDGIPHLKLKKVL